LKGPALAKEWRSMSSLFPQRWISFLLQVLARTPEHSQIMTAVCENTEHNQIRVLCNRTRNSHKTLMYPLQKLHGPMSGKILFCRVKIFWPLQMWRWHNALISSLVLLLPPSFLTSLLHPPILFLHFLLHLKSFLLYILFSFSLYIFFLFIWHLLCLQYLRPNNFELGP